MLPILAHTLIPLSLSLLMQICAPQAEVVVPENATVSAVFTFGDSILDTGNNNHLITLVKSNFPPYGRHFMGGKPTGRFSNGMIPSDFFAQLLGIKELLPAFLDPNLQLQDLIGGVNFASAGAGFDPLTSELMSVIPMLTQLRLFDEYKTKLTSSIGEERAESIVANGLYIVSAGSNDIAATYFHTPTRIFDYSIPSYTELLVRSASSFLQELHTKGARRIGVFSLSPLGCTPSQRTLAGGIARRCAEDDNRMAQLFNLKLSSELRRLNGAFPHARMTLVDTYGLLLDIMKNPTTYVNSNNSASGTEVSELDLLSSDNRFLCSPVLTGFEISDRGCCGSGLIEAGFMCSQWDFLTCSNASGHVFWDAFHPTENAYKILVQGLLGKLLLDVCS